LFFALNQRKHIAKLKIQPALHIPPISIVFF
jgi:hypothetical protein